MALGVFPLMAGRSCSTTATLQGMSGSLIWIGRRCAGRPLRGTTRGRSGGLERSILRSTRIERGPVSLYTKRVHSGPGEVEKLATEDLEGLLPSSWSPDGGRLAFLSAEEGSDYGIKTLSREGKVEPFLQTRFGERWPEFSPDGRWMVYGSNDSGPWQIYARPYPGPGPAVQISTQGGTRPAWSRDGQEIFFRQGGKCYSVGIETDGEHLIPGLPVELFEDRRYRVSTPIRSYDVAPDGRFLHMKVPDEAAMTAITEEFFPTRIRLIQNWFEELKRLVPTDH